MRRAALGDAATTACSRPAAISAWAPSAVSSAYDGGTVTGETVLFFPGPAARGSTASLRSASAGKSTVR